MSSGRKLERVALSTESLSFRHFLRLFLVSTQVHKIGRKHKFYVKGWKARLTLKAKGIFRPKKYESCTKTEKMSAQKNMQRLL